MEWRWLILARMSEFQAIYLVSILGVNDYGLISSDRTIGGCHLGHVMRRNNYSIMFRCKAEHPRSAQTLILGASYDDTDEDDPSGTINEGVNYGNHGNADNCRSG